METQNNQNSNPYALPPHIKSLFYKNVGQRNLFISDLQHLLNSTSDSGSNMSTRVEDIIKEISNCEAQLSSLQKLFPSLIEEEENFREFALRKKVEAIKRSEKNENTEKHDSPKEQSSTAQSSPPIIDGQKTDLYEDGKVVTKFK